MIPTQLAYWTAISGPRLEPFMESCEGTLTQKDRPSRLKDHPVAVLSLHEPSRENVSRSSRNVPTGIQILRQSDQIPHSHDAPRPRPTGRLIEVQSKAQCTTPLRYAGHGGLTFPFAARRGKARVTARTCFPSTHDATGRNWRTTLEFRGPWTHSQTLLS